MAGFRAMRLLPRRWSLKGILGVSSFDLLGRGSRERPAPAPPQWAIHYHSPACRSSPQQAGQQLRNARWGKRSTAAWEAFGGLWRRCRRPGPIFGGDFFEVRRHGRGELAREEKMQGVRPRTGDVGLSARVREGRCRQAELKKQEQVDGGARRMRAAM